MAVYFAPATIGGRAYFAPSAPTTSGGVTLKRLVLINGRLHVATT